MSVVLVGAGPGDPDLLTVRALRELTAADVIVHDALVDDRVLALARPGTELIDVGKRPGRPVPQEMINTLLIELGGDHRRVVRLKGGDPFVFGRGGEELAALTAAGIDVDVVPGVSSVLAAPALAGVPLTHRGVAHSFTVVTGHRVGDAPEPDWARLAARDTTLVVVMGVARRGEIAAALLAAGMSPATPVAAVMSASTRDDAVVRGRLDELATADVRAPAVLVIGAVAGLTLTAADPHRAPAFVSSARRDARS